MNAIIVIISIIISVLSNSCIASFFLLSKYHIVGLPNTNVPVSAAENTNNISIPIGIIIVSGVFCNVCPK